MNFFPKVSTVTAPSIILRSVGDMRPYRIEVDVGRQFEKICISVHHDSFISPLKNMSGFLVSPVVPLGIAQGYVLHDPGQWDFADLDLQVDMVAHKAKGVYPLFESLAGLMDDLIKTIPVLVVRENVLTGVASKDYVIDCPRGMYAWFSRHR
jgi:hypothetical protein